MFTKCQKIIGSKDGIVGFWNSHKVFKVVTEEEVQTAMLLFLFKKVKYKLQDSVI